MTATISNAHAGHAFEHAVLQFLSGTFPALEPNARVAIGINGKKNHKFDLGDLKAKVVVECKRHKWTAGGYVPSAKLSGWNEAMYLFHAAPKSYRKIFFALRDYSKQRGMTLAEYYIKTYAHLIPKDVEIWEYDARSKTGTQVYPA